MYNKIASIILNAARADGLSDVFVAQPDALKENLAGKIFLLAEVGGKKAEGRKLFDFLVAALGDNYYNDEKILFRDKIEGLKIENIFEAAIAKTNRQLADFLISEKIRLNPAATSITLGLVYENKLYFSNFGRNRALLIYRHGDGYELINVEANAQDSLETDTGEAGDAAEPHVPKFFSSVISGEVPPNSYFIFTSEALPEYLSGKDLISIVTKLPPIAAAEQIKNVLLKINTYVPFLGIIIKNTASLPGGAATVKEELEASLAHSSISSLNYTEQKTEAMLAPAGLINLPKLVKSAKDLVNRLSIGSASVVKAGRKYSKLQGAGRSDNTENGAAPDLGVVKSLRIARPDSFMLKEKIVFKKKDSWVATAGKKLSAGIVAAISPHFWSDLAGNLKLWLSGLSQKNRWLVLTLSSLVVIFIVSIVLTNWRHQQQVIQDNFNNLVNNIENDQSAIDGHLLYGDEAGAKAALLAAQATLSSLPQDTASQRATYARLATGLNASAEKIEKIVHPAVTKIGDVSDLGLSSLAFVGGKIYAAASSTVYKITPGSSTYLKFNVAGAVSLNNPVISGNNIYYADNNRIIEFAAPAGAVKPLKINSLDPAASLAGFSVFYSNLYVLAPANSQIYRYNSAAGGFSGNKTNWLQTPTDLSQAKALAIDGDIYVLENNGQVLKFFKGQSSAFSSSPIVPVMTAANQLVLGQKNIYVFDPGSQRLAVLSKTDGHLLNQYALDGLAAPRSFAVDENGKTAYFLDSGGIYKVTLNQ